MGEAKQKRLHGIGSTRLDPMVDMDAAIEDLERHVEGDKIEGFVQIAMLRPIGPGVNPLKLWTMGLTKQQAYDAICIIKREFESTMGFREVNDGR